MTRLILIEGMIGAGKSTTAARLARALAERGEAVRFHHEFADDHPIPTEAVDRLRATLPGGGARPPAVEGDGGGRGPAAYAVARWGELALRCRHGRRTEILESTFLQNSVLPSFADDAPISTVRTVFARIGAQLAPASPLLVYLRPSDVERAVKRSHRERGEPWASGNVAWVSSCPWARRRELRGQDAVVAFYRAWERVVDELLEAWAFEKLLLVDPQHDWEGALRRICATLRA